MKTKALFLMLFVPLHAFVTLHVLQHMFNPPRGGGSAVFKVLSVLLTSPILLPLVMFDPDGDRLAKWLQLISVPSNSVVWGLGLLPLFGVARRFHAPKRVSQ